MESKQRGFQTFDIVLHQTKASNDQILLKRPLLKLKNPFEPFKISLRLKNANSCFYL